MMSKYPLQLFNTLTNDKQNFEPNDAEQAERENRPAQVSMYVCGPTVYDDAHLGHARCYITWDVLYRFLKFLGYDVKYVRNVTDVDDKILNRAKERGELPSELAKRNYESFTADMQALNVLPPDDDPHATQYIPQMLEGILALIQNNAAYATPDGSVYFRVSAKSDYGKLSKKPLDDLKAGARVEIDQNKESPLDFALWKAVPLEDANGWESPWPAEGQTKGWGRPGWHMECSAMNHAVFGDQIDIHAGGADLIFPHHENEIAQSEAWTGKAPFAKYWLHNGFVNVSGEKMSKSLGNFSTIKKVLEHYDANVVRHFLLTNKYRMPVDFNDEALQSSRNWVTSRYKEIRQASEKLNLNRESIKSCLIRTFKELKNMESVSELDGNGDSLSLVNAMLDDLNTSVALEKLTLISRRLNQQGMKMLDGSSVQSDSEFYNSFRHAVSIWELLGFDLTLVLSEINASEEEKEYLSRELAKRKQAKVEKNWSQADSIRNEIISSGFHILDNKDGTTSVEKDGVEIVRV